METGILSHATFPVLQLQNMLLNKYFWARYTSAILNILKEIFFNSQTVPIKYIFILLLTIYHKGYINEYIRPYSLPKSSTVQNKMKKMLPLCSQVKNIIILGHKM